MRRASVSILSVLILAGLVLAPAAASTEAAIGPSVADAAVLHLQLDRSAPEKDATLEASPEEIRLWFSQAAEKAVSQIGLEGPEGEIELGELEQSEDRTILFVAIPEPLPAGSYTVSWRTSSGDGHPIRGEFAFQVASGPGR